MFIKIDNPPHELQAKLIRIYGETKGTTQNYKSVISNDKISKRIATDSDNTGGNDAGNEAIRFYEDLILKEIQAAKYYPEYSQLRKEEGKVIVKFKLRPDGSLSAKPEIIKSCGYLHLNRAALNTVIYAAPFPKFYENIDATEMNFVVTLEYLL
jgi:TonB family protein